MINVTAATDGQGAFKNGMHDAIGGVHSKDNLYRKTYISNKSHTLKADVNRLLWSCGHLFQRITGLGHVNALIPCVACRHRHDPEKMAQSFMGFFICYKCKQAAAGDQP